MIVIGFVFKERVERLLFMKKLRSV